MKQTAKIWFSSIFIILLVTILILYHIYIPLEERTIFNFVTLISGYISAYGLIVAIVQILVLQNITKSTRQAINETKAKINQLLSIADLAKTIAILRIIQEYINNDKYEHAKIRLCDVKDFMTRIEYIKDLDYNKEVFKKLRKRIEINLSNLDKQISNNIVINKIIFCSDMEEIASMLSKLENQLKTK